MDFSISKSARTAIRYAIGERTIEIGGHETKVNTGLKTFVKSWQVYSKGNAGSFGRGLKYCQVDGNTRIRFHKNARIINKGKLWFGIHLPCTYRSGNDSSTLEMYQNSRFVINGNVSIGSSVFFFIWPDATLEIGDNVIIGSLSNLICSKSIQIGNDCLIGWDVEIHDTDGHKIVRDGFELAKPIAIGDHVWVGSRAMILKGVKIGSNSVVAKGAIVTRDVPENCIVAGSPARVIREHVTWEP